MWTSLKRRELWRIRGATKLMLLTSMCSSQWLTDRRTNRKCLFFTPGPGPLTLSARLHCPPVERGGKAMSSGSRSRARGREGGGAGGAARRCAAAGSSFSNFSSPLSFFVHWVTQTFPSLFFFNCFFLFNFNNNLIYFSFFFWMKFGQK